MKIDDEFNRNTYNKQLINKTAKAIRHIILIRHGQYNTEAKTDADGTLTTLGQYLQYMYLVKCTIVIMNC